MYFMKFMERAWRLFATILSFMVFGIGGLIMGLLVFPLVFLFQRNPIRRKVIARSLIGKAFGGFWEMIYVLRVLDYKIEGLDGIDSEASRLIIANHPTLIDVVILLSLFPQANCVIKSAVTRNPFMRSVVRAADYISNNEPDELLESCISYLQAGGSLMLFPEGTRTGKDGKIVFKPGAATVAARTGTHVLPVAIRCDPLFLSKEHPWYFVPRQRPTFTIRVLGTLSASDANCEEENPRKARHALNIEIWSCIQHGLRNMEFYG
jgi:1-acyl-sn-glycerol-3-phosphate acyltransferase